MDYDVVKLHEVELYALPHKWGHLQQVFLKPPYDILPHKITVKGTTAEVLDLAHRKWKGQDIGGLIHGTGQLHVGRYYGGLHYHLAHHLGQTVLSPKDQQEFSAPGRLRHLVKHHDVSRFIHWQDVNRLDLELSPNSEVARHHTAKFIETLRPSRVRIDWAGPEGYKTEVHGDWQSAATAIRPRAKGGAWDDDIRARAMMHARLLAKAGIREEVYRIDSLFHGHTDLHTGDNAAELLPSVSKNTEVGGLVHKSGTIHAGKYYPALHYDVAHHLMKQDDPTYRIPRAGSESLKRARNRHHAVRFIYAGKGVTSGSWRYEKQRTRRLDLELLHSSTTARKNAAKLIRDLQPDHIRIDWAGRDPKLPPFEIFSNWKDAHAALTPRQGHWDDQEARRLIRGRIMQRMIAAGLKEGKRSTYRIWRQMLEQRKTKPRFLPTSSLKLHHPR